MAEALEEVAALPDPVGEVIESSIRPNGLEVHKVRVPLGVVFFIYESRPNVTADAAAICVKSGNAVILRGGKEAAHSNLAIVEMLHEAAADAGLPADAVQLVDTTDRDAVGHFLTLPRVHRRGHSARRREPDPPRGRRGQDAGDQALHRQLPRLRRSRPPTWTMAERIIDQLQVPAAGRVQRGRVAAGSCRRGRPSSCRGIGQALARARHRDPRRRADARTDCPRPSRRPTRITPPSISARSSRSRWSIRSTRRSSTSTATARSTPTRS